MFNFSRHLPDPLGNGFVGDQNAFDFVTPARRNARSRSSCGRKGVNIHQFGRWIRVTKMKRRRHNQKNPPASTGSKPEVGGASVPASRLNSIKHGSRGHSPHQKVQSRTLTFELTLMNRIKNRCLLCDFLWPTADRSYGSSSLPAPLL